MTGLETLWKISIATPVVWRLTGTVASAYGVTGQQGFGGVADLARLRPEEVLGTRAMDCLYWTAMWMSPQTALWVVCGFAGVLVAWLPLAGIARFSGRTRLVPLTTRRSTSSAVRDADASTEAAQLCR